MDEETESKEVVIGIHWLTLVLIRERVEQSVAEDLRLVQALLCFSGHRELPWWPGKGDKGYRQSIVGPFGCTIAWEPYGPTKAGLDHLLIKLPGKYCEAVPFMRLSTIVGSLKSYFRLTCTRLDLAFDNCPFAINQVLEAVRASNVNTQLRRTKKWEGRRVISHKLYVEPTEGTPSTGLQIGQGNSGRMITLYDRRGFVRLELRLRENHAQNAFEHLLIASPDPGEVARLCVSLLRSFINFIDRESDTKTSRCELLPWWEAMVGQVPRYRGPSITRRKTTLERKENWLREQVAKTLYCVTCFKSNPKAFVDQLLQHGRSLMRPEDYKRVGLSVEMGRKDGKNMIFRNKELKDAE